MSHKYADIMYIQVFFHVFSCIGLKTGVLFHYWFQQISLRFPVCYESGTRVPDRVSTGTNYIMGKKIPTKCCQKCHVT